MEAIKQPLNYQQIEMLKLFAKEMEEDDYLIIKRMIVKFLAKRLDVLANELWEENGWTNEDMRNLLKNHDRASNPKN